MKNARGAIKLQAPGKPTLKYHDVTLTMTNVDPDLFELVTNQQLITDSRANVIGIRQNEFVDSKGVAIETWSLSGNEAGSCVAGVGNYGYFLAPQIVNGRMGDITLNDGALSCVLMGRTKRGSLWGVGPYNVVDSAVSGAVVPGKLLTAVAVGDHVLMLQTPVAPPAAACGAGVLVAA